MAKSIQVSGKLLKGQLKTGKWVADDKDILLRLLCLGSRSETYNKIDWTSDMINIMCVDRLVSSGRGMEVLDTIKEMSLKKRVPKMDVLIAVYAFLLTQTTDMIVKRQAFSSINDICEIPTHLFCLINYSEKFAKGLKNSTGWGNGKRKAVAKWYNQFAANPQKLAMYVTKYQRRHGWSHIDVLRLAHVQPADLSTEMILNYAMKGLDNTRARFPQFGNLLAYFQAVEDIKRANANVTVFSNLITQHRLLREHIPPQTRLLNNPVIWMALLNDMPLQAMLKNLKKMTNLGLLNRQSAGSMTVCHKLSNVTEGQVHPFSILVARKAYEQFVPTPNPDIIEALDNAFTSAFKGADETGFRFCVAVDLDVSMNEKVPKCPILTATEVAAAMVLTAVNTESSCDVLALGENATQINMGRNDSLQEAIARFTQQPVGPSDCSRPLKWAVLNKKTYDVFIVYTSCDATLNEYPAAQALADYRIMMENPNTKLIVCAMTTKDYTIVDPQDLGMLNIAGFDANIPGIISNFVKYLQRD